MLGASLTGTALKNFVLGSVTERTPVDDLERADVARFVEAFDRLDHPFDRDADRVHVTGSGFIVGPRGTVLLRHLKINLWLQPGGHIDPGETPWEAARREVTEETGLRVQFAGGSPELVHVSVHDVPGGHTHLDLRYLFEGGDADPAPATGESQDVHWFDWPVAIARAEPSLSGILRHLRARLA